MKAYGLALTLGLAVGMFAPQALARDDDHISSSAVPKLDHVFVIVLENHNSFTSFGSIGILDNPQAPQIQALADTYNVAPNYHGVWHPSLPNYLAMITGDWIGTDVLGVPLWKASYRLSLPAEPHADHARLQGWAILENFSGQDWRDVSLTLLSGNPVTFRQALFESYYVKRPSVPVEVAGRVLPSPDTGGIAGEVAARGAAGPSPVKRAEGRDNCGFRRRSDGGTAPRARSSADRSRSSGGRRRDRITKPVKGIVGHRARRRRNSVAIAGGTDGSNPLSSSGESGANLIFGGESHF